MAWPLLDSRANDPGLHRIWPDSVRPQKGRASLTLPWSC